MIELRRVEEADVAAFLRLRNEIHPRDPMSAAALAAARGQPGRHDLVALLDGAPAGIGTLGRHFVDPAGPVGSVGVRVRRAARRRGVGTALFARLSEQAASDGRSELYTVVPEDDADSLAYLGKRGFRRVLAMQGVALDLASAPGDATSLVRGLEVVPLAPELDADVYDAALEIEQDLMTDEPIATPDYETWHARQFPPHVRRDLSFAVLAGGRVVGYAILDAADGIGGHAVTGVRRDYRRRGIGLALKQAQIAAARAAGLRELRATNTVENAPMRRLNERLGFRPTWVELHLRGPLLR